MDQFTYTPDEQIQIHRENAIRHMCRPFLSHENGLPEWVKNSAAAYLREEREPVMRAVVLAFSHQLGSSHAAIACLDFVGMTSTQIERDFRRWADPDAATRASSESVQLGELGGHGNGGKCYMTQMFEHHSTLHTVRNGLGCRYGVKAGSVAFGYVPDRPSGRDFPVADVPSEIDACLRLVRAGVEGLPDGARQAASCADGFTFVCGFGPKDCDRRIPVQNLVENLLGHHQMMTPLQVCSIYVLVNGRAFNDGQPLSLPRITPMRDFEEPRTLGIPESLADPLSDRAVSTTAIGALPPGELRIFTSDKSMRRGRGAPRKWRHTVTYHTRRSGVIGRASMTDLDVDSNFRDYMYCDCVLESLDDCQQNDRGRLAESPLSRATEQWISGQVQAYCREFEARERRLLREQDRNELSRINEWLDRWKNQFMREFMHGLFGEGEGGSRGTGGALPSGTPTSMEVSTGYRRAGVGVYFRPTLKFFDGDGSRIRPAPYRWVSEDNNVAMVDEDLRLIQTFSFGTTSIYAETLDGRLQSNAIDVEVVRILEIRVVPHELTMSAGTKRSLEAMCRLSSGDEVSGVYLTWMEGTPTVARVSARGLVYGFAPGQTEVTALDESCRSDIGAIVTVTPSEGVGAGTRRGRGFPKILISENDHAPGEEEPATFRRDEPPVCQRVQDSDSNVWWINLASPFARLYSDPARGYGVNSEAWRMYHVERVIDVLIQIALSHGPDSTESFDCNDWVFRSSEIEAEIRAKAIESLTGFILHGETE